MFLITEKRQLNPSVSSIRVHAPYVVKHAKAGQFVMLRVEPNGERIPMTIADANHADGTIQIIFQVVGATTHLLNQLNEGDYIIDFVGPLGKPTLLDNLKKVAVIGGGVGCAIAYPIVKALYKQHTIIHTIIGFSSTDKIIMKDEFDPMSDQLIITTDDGSYGMKGFVTDALKKLLDSGETYDEVFAIGPIPMMKQVSILTKQYQIKTTVSMNPIMVDGTGMCGGCRVTVDGKMKFACVDGPDFDGHLVDFDEVERRNKMYEEIEKNKYNQACKMIKGDINDV